jgi:hypothetical protein
MSRKNCSTLARRVVCRFCVSLARLAIASRLSSIYKLPLALASGLRIKEQAALAKIIKNKFPFGFSLILAKAKRMIDFFIKFG